jgi:hypothetical protein
MNKNTDIFGTSDDDDLYTNPMEEFKLILKEVLDIDESDNYYDEKTISYIRIMYLLAISLWVIIVYSLKLYETDIYGKIIISLPIISFIIAWISLPMIKKKYESQAFKSNFVSLVLLLSLPILALLERQSGGTPAASKAIIVAMACLIFSMLDWWISNDYLSINKHFKSVFQTFAITLLIYSIYRYYNQHEKNKIKDSSLMILN